MFIRLESELRGRGENPLADAVHALLESRGKDIPLGESTFTTEQRKALERQGYVIYSLTGQSIASLRDAGLKFSSPWHEEKSFEFDCSLHTDVAINPTMLFLPESDYKRENEQIVRVADFGREIGIKVPGTTAILGSAPDYAELTLLHLSATGKRLFGGDYNFGYTRTTTRTDESSVVAIGSFNKHKGLNLFSMVYWGWGEGHWAAPLVVPTSAVRR